MLLQVLEKLKTDHRDIHLQTQEFNGESFSTLHYMIREEQPKIFKQTTLIYPITLQELPNSRNSVKPE